VNKCPHLAPPLDSTPPEGVAWLAAGLVRRGDGAAAPWLGRLVEQVGERREGAVDGVGRLLGACWWRHAVTGVLYKQRAWSYLLPALTAPEGGPGRLAALVMLLPHLPRPLLVSRLPALLPLVVRALSDPTTALHALNCLGDFVKVEVGLVASHLQEVVDRCLELAVQGTLVTRTTALQVGRWRPSS